MITMTPLKVEILLHYWYSPEDYDPERIGFPAQQEAIGEFVAAGLIRENLPGSSPRYTGNSDALRVYVEAILAVPVPHQEWIL